MPLLSRWNCRPSLSLREQHRFSVESSKHPRNGGTAFVGTNFRLAVMALAQPAGDLFYGKSKAGR